MRRYSYVSACFAISLSLALSLTLSVFVRTKCDRWYSDRRLAMAGTERKWKGYDEDKQMRWVCVWFWCGCHCFYLFMFALKWFVASTLYLFRLKQITCYKTARERLLLSLLYCISHPSLYDFSMKIGNERMWMELCISLYDDVVGKTLLHRCGYGLSAHSHTRILAINASIQLYTTIKYSIVRVPHTHKLPTNCISIDSSSLSRDLCHSWFYIVEPQFLRKSTLSFSLNNKRHEAPSISVQFTLHTLRVHHTHIQTRIHSVRHHDYVD